MVNPNACILWRPKKGRWYKAFLQKGAWYCSGNKKKHCDDTTFKILLIFFKFVVELVVL